MSITEKVKRTVWVRDGGCCAICRERVFLDGNKYQPAQFRGQVAHIVAEQKEGPRGDSPLTPQQRNHESNLLLLCYSHHAEIDTNIERYPVDRLKEVQVLHASWLADKLRYEAPWTTKLHNFYYLNVPRLLALAAISGRSLDLSRYGQIIALHELGWELNGLMLGFKTLIEKIEVKALPLHRALEIGEASRGTIVSFDQPFRTKNIEMPRSIEGYNRAVRGNVETDPQIYTKVGDRKVTLVIDPRWVTTTTAFVQFRPDGGRGTFAGFGLVNAIDNERVSATPLVIGLPSNPFIEAIFGAD